MNYQPLVMPTMRLIKAVEPISTRARTPTSPCGVRARTEINELNFF